MSDHTNWTEFSRFVPGFDFLRNLVPSGLAGVPTASTASSAQNVFQQWLAPTMDEAEVQKRIDELKVVQFWLEQNGRALQATIQALEVQKMTLSALKTMGKGAQDMAQGMAEAFGDSLRAMETPEPDTADTPVPPPWEAEPAARAEAPASGDAEADPDAETSAEKSADTNANAQALAGMTEHMQQLQGQALQWWGALTEQFQTIAHKALEDIGQQVGQHMQAAAEPPATPPSPPSPEAPPARPAAKPRKTPTRKTPAKKTTAKTVAKKTAAKKTAVKKKG